MSRKRPLGTEPFALWLSLLLGGCTFDAGHLSELIHCEDDSTCGWGYICLEGLCTSSAHVPSDGDGNGPDGPDGHGDALAGADLDAPPEDLSTGFERACYYGPAEKEGVGVCRGGISFCYGGACGPCLGQVLPAPSDDCSDSLDNDCDGLVNEECLNCQEGDTKPCFSGSPENRGVGECRDGLETCTNGEWVCVGSVLPASEMCDGRDNDCDGVYDEELIPSPNVCPGPQGVCIAAKPECLGEEGWVCVMPPSQELIEITCSDGLDNDCDGAIDCGDPDCQAKAECNVLCTPGDLRPCMLQRGVCAGAAQLCNSESRWDMCDYGPLYEQVEVSCDGVDNDCDGTTDLDLNVPVDVCPLLGVCYYDGTPLCLEEEGWSCQLPVSYEEVEVSCDSKDNDCDGMVDEGLVRPCNNDCGPGEQSCSNGLWGLCTAPLPVEEVCDGVDNDCNGLVDDGLFRECRTVCGTGEERCIDGDWGECSAREPEDEVCDNEDNDCDGQVDDGLTQECSTPCGVGVEVCTFGVWTGCTAPQPQTETCDNHDNDCDGAVDEELSRSCSSLCGQGRERCVNGQWVECDAPQPTAEVCDGQDNDCNDIIDDGGCYSFCDACTHSSQCQSGLCIHHHMIDLVRDESEYTSSICADPCPQTGRCANSRNICRELTTVEGATESVCTPLYTTCWGLDDVGESCSRNGDCGDPDFRDGVCVCDHHPCSSNSFCRAPCDPGAPFEGCLEGEECLPDPEGDYPGFCDSGRR